MNITYWLQLSKLTGEHKKCLCKVDSVNKGIEAAKVRHLPNGCKHWVGEYHNGLLHKRHDV